jgi:hypothetical protein
LKPIQQNILSQASGLNKVLNGCCTWTVPQKLAVLLTAGPADNTKAATLPNLTHGLQHTLYQPPSQTQRDTSLA